MTTGALALPITEAPRVVEHLELRCPNCHNKVLTYRSPDPLFPPVQVAHRCRRCHSMIEADLQAGAPAVRLRPE